MTKEYGACASHAG